MSDPDLNRIARALERIVELLRNRWECGEQKEHSFPNCAPMILTCREPKGHEGSHRVLTGLALNDAVVWSRTP